jgi:hypothetical protein
MIADFKLQMGHRLKVDCSVNFRVYTACRLRVDGS